MAEGRMLKRAVSDSRKLSELKTDAARLLWTWILPYLDIEGRYYADPDMIKGKIVPRIKTFTPTNVATYLIDMARVKLIILYEIDGEKYLQFRNFREFQNIRESHEAKSKIPPPESMAEDNYSNTTVELQESYSNCTMQSNLIKFNLSNNARRSKNGIGWDITVRDFINITKEDIIGWEEAYPAIDIQDQLLRAREWIRANPKKVKKNWNRFFINWFSNAQDKGR